MSDLDVAGLKKSILETIDLWAAGAPSAAPSPANELTEVKDERIIPEGKRAVRTKTSGDRVYILDDKDKSRRWVSSPEILKSLGFELGDVKEVEDIEMAKYTMGPAIYKVDA